jgi:hypothetical protein
MGVATIGFRAKTARAIAGALAGDTSAPTYVSRWEIALHDPVIPRTSQPHHHLMELSWVDAIAAARELEIRIEAVAMEKLGVLLNELRSKNHEVRAIGVVGSPDRDLEKIGNRHMRAHAAEGILFRRVLETVAGAHRLKWAGFTDRDFESLAASTLGLPPLDVKTTLVTLGRAAGKPWRADERLAASAAWLALGNIQTRNTANKT